MWYPNNGGPLIIDSMFDNWFNPGPKAIECTRRKFPVFTEPANDPAAFGDNVRAAITSLSNADNANMLTDILLPDVLTFDTSSSDGFLNGRRLADDVIDAELNLLSAGAVAGDGVDMNDVAFRTSFPYLVPEPSGITLVLFGLAAICGFRLLRGARRRA